jgi:hypothetical protein
MTTELTIRDHAVRKHGTHSKGKGVEYATFVGIDGEGINVNLDTCWLCKQPKNAHTKLVEHPFVEEHRYILLAAAKETHETQGTLPEKGLSTENLSTRECLDFILDIALSHKIFAYAFGYDLTCMLRDIDDESLFKLFRPELRARKGPNAIMGPWPIRWESGQFLYFINLQGTKFSVTRFDRCPSCWEADRNWNARYGAQKKGRRAPRHVRCDACKDSRRRQVIWDIWKFYQCKFVGALKDWKVGLQDVERIEAMKDKRSVLYAQTPEAVRTYCLSECKHMGTLARALTNAHARAGLKLRSYYGAGSTGSAMLTVMATRERLPMPVPEEMRFAVASAFVGGRFEHSVAGIVRDEVFGHDISNAYPYAIAFLPCMGWQDPKTGRPTKVCGRWELTRNRADIFGAHAACVHYGMVPLDSDEPWAAFPFRERDGSISFPRSSEGGWLWKAEYLAGESVFPNHIFFREAWVWKSECTCKRPFEALPRYYKERIKIGKEGPGIVIKLGMNSCAGKLMQSVGSAMFNSWIWGGMVTSQTRSQILNIMGLHRDRSNMFAVATDGVYTREDITTPRPDDTDTWELPDDEGKIAKKPMGGWETKSQKKGMFFLRPGIYFPLNPVEEEIKEVRGRGVGKRMLLTHWEKIVSGWEDGSRVVSLPALRRFHGAKSSISYGEKSGYTRSPLYGQWTERPVELIFDAMPKRIDFDVVCGPIDRRPELIPLVLRETANLKPIKGGRSAPYNKSVKSQEAKALIAFKEMQEEQDDMDMSEMLDLMGEF